MIINKTSPNNLAPEHLRDLRKSGLSDDTLKEAGIRSIPPGDLNKKIGPNRDGVVSAYEILFANGYSRFRVFYERGKEYEKNGDPKPKYLARKGSGNRLYIPPKVKLILNDVSIPLYIVEGEKKSLKACQEGENCIGISGLWNFKNKDEDKLIPDYDQTALNGRTITIVPDSHWLQPNRKGESKNLKQAVYNHAYFLIDKGARVSWLELPVGEEEVKLDDYLCDHTLEELRALPVHEIRKLTLDELISEATPDIKPYERKEIEKGIAGCTSATGRSQYINQFHEKTKIAKLAIAGEVKSINNKGDKTDKTPNVVESLKKTVRSISLNPAQDYKDGIMYYAIMIEGRPYLITSEREIISFAQAEDRGLNLATTLTDTFRFSPKGILRYYEDGEDVSVSKIYKKIHDLLKDYIFFKHDFHCKFLATWVIGTYIFRGFNYFPYIWINAPKESGKTLLMQVLMEISFNGDLSTNATESVMFRDVHNNSITMFLDEVESLGKQDKEKYGAVMSILNVGFSNTGIVKRTIKRDNDFSIERFCAYSPKVISGIKELDDVVQARTIKVLMYRKKKGEVIKRYKQTRELLQAQENIRDSLYIFGLKYARDIFETYNNRSHEIEGLNNLDSRELDIWEPIFTIANTIDIENNSSELTDSLSEFSGVSNVEKSEDDRDLNDTIKLLSVLKKMLDTGGGTPDVSLPTPPKNMRDCRNGEIEGHYKTGEVFRYFQGSDEFNWMEDKRKSWLTRELKLHAKIKTKNIRPKSQPGKKITRVYIINTDEFEDLARRYLPAEED